MKQTQNQVGGPEKDRLVDFDTTLLDDKTNGDNDKSICIVGFLSRGIGIGGRRGNTSTKNTYSILECGNMSRFIETGFLKRKINTFFNIFSEKK